MVALQGRGRACLFTIAARYDNENQSKWQYLWDTMPVYRECKGSKVDADEMKLEGVVDKKIEGVKLFFESREEAR